MTAVSLKPPVAQLLIAGKLALLSPSSNRADHQHLVPIAVPPPCPTCNGTGESTWDLDVQFPDVCGSCAGSGFFTGDVAITTECRIGETFHGHDAGEVCLGQRPVASATIEKVLPIVSLHSVMGVPLGSDPTPPAQEFLTYEPNSTGKVGAPGPPGWTEHGRLSWWKANDELTSCSDTGHLNHLLGLSFDWADYLFALLVSGVVPV